MPTRSSARLSSWQQHQEYHHEQQEHPHPHPQRAMFTWSTSLNRPIAGLPRCESSFTNLPVARPIYAEEERREQQQRQASTCYVSESRGSSHLSSSTLDQNDAAQSAHSDSSARRQCHPNRSRRRSSNGRRRRRHRHGRHGRRCQNNSKDLQDKPTCPTPQDAISISSSSSQNTTKPPNTPPTSSSSFPSSSSRHQGHRGTATVLGFPTPLTSASVQTSNGSSQSDSNRHLSANNKTMLDMRMIMPTTTNDPTTRLAILPYHEFHVQPAVSRANNKQPAIDPFATTATKTTTTMSSFSPTIQDRPKPQYRDFSFVATQPHTSPTGKRQALWRVVDNNSSAYDGGDDVNHNHNHNHNHSTPPLIDNFHTDHYQQQQHHHLQDPFVEEAKHHDDGVIASLTTSPLWTCWFADDEVRDDSTAGILPPTTFCCSSFSDGCCCCSCWAATSLQQLIPHFVQQPSVALSQARRHQRQQANTTVDATATTAAAATATCMKATPSIASFTPKSSTSHRHLSSKTRSNSRGDSYSTNDAPPHVATSTLNSCWAGASLMQLIPSFVQQPSLALLHSRTAATVTTTSSSSSSQRQHYSGEMTKPKSVNRPSPRTLDAKGQRHYESYKRNNTRAGNIPTHRSPPRSTEATYKNYDWNPQDAVPQIATEVALVNGYDKLSFQHPATKRPSLRQRLCCRQALLGGED